MILYRVFKDFSIFESISLHFNSDFVTSSATVIRFCRCIHIYEELLLSVSYNFHRRMWQGLILKKIFFLPLQTCLCSPAEYLKRLPNGMTYNGITLKNATKQINSAEKMFNNDKSILFRIFYNQTNEVVF